jgi:hypothetical protein
MDLNNMTQKSEFNNVKLDQKNVLQANRPSVGELKNQATLLERGVVGRFFGVGNSAAINFACTVGLICLFAALYILFFWDNTKKEISTKDAILLFTNIVTLVMGYIFGKTTKD